MCVLWMITFCRYIIPRIRVNTLYILHSNNCRILSNEQRFIVILYVSNNYNVITPCLCSRSRFRDQTFRWTTPAISSSKRKRSKNPNTTAPIADPNKRERTEARKTVGHDCPPILRDSKYLQYLRKERSARMRINCVQITV